MITIREVVKGRNFPDMIKGIYEEATPNITLNGERVKVFPLASGRKQDACFHHCYPYCVGSSSLKDQTIKIKGLQVRKEEKSVCRR